MDMQVDAQLIKSERLKRAWSQEQLAQVSGLGIRTVQRVESGGNASLETIKALAAVLELPVESLLTNTAAEQPITLPSTHRFSLFRPVRAFVTGCISTLAVVAGFVMQTAIAEQVALDMDLQVNDAAVRQSRMVSEDGVAAVVQIDDLKISIKPVIQKDGSVFLDSEISYRRNGEYEVVAHPRMTVRNTTPAGFNVTSDNGSLVKLKVTPTIE